MTFTRLLITWSNLFFSYWSRDGPWFGSTVKYTITAESIRFLDWKYTIILRKVYDFWLKLYDDLKNTIFKLWKYTIFRLKIYDFFTESIRCFWWMYKILGLKVYDYWRIPMTHTLWVTRYDSYRMSHQLRKVYDYWRMPMTHKLWVNRYDSYRMSHQMRNVYDYWRIPMTHTLWVIRYESSNLGLGIRARD